MSFDDVMKWSTHEHQEGRDQEQGRRREGVHSSPAPRSQADEVADEVAVAAHDPGGPAPAASPGPIATHGGVHMSVRLVAMPWQAIALPSLPLGLLTAAVAAAGLPTPSAYHASLRWAELLLDRTGGKIQPDHYTDVAENGLFHGLGDWVFTGVLHDDPDFGVAAVHRYARDEGVDLAVVEQMREHAADFVELAVAEILDGDPTVVGFSSTFMQNVPSLAVARRIKQQAPRTLLVLGAPGARPLLARRVRRSARQRDEPAAAARTDPDTDVRRLVHGDRAVAAHRVPGAETGAGDRPRLLVGREAPLHVLRTERLDDAVPREAAGPRPG